MVDLHNKNVPVDFDLETGKNVKWSVELHSPVNGSPSVANGRVFIGTRSVQNGEGVRSADMATLLCLREADGHLL